MRSRQWYLILAGLALLFSSSSAAAQQLKAGTWTGTIAPPGNEPAQATYEVTVRGDTTAITIKTEFGELPFTDIKVETDRLTFTFEPGTPVNCVLMLRDDGSYAGECVDSDGDPGILVMIPPATSPGAVPAAGVEEPTGLPSPTA